MKRTVLTLLALAVSGLFLMGTGLAFSANTNLYIDGSGIHVGNTDEKIIKKENAEAFSDIEVDMASAEIKVIPAASYGFEIGSNHNMSFEYSNENGKLKIIQKFRLSWNIFNFNCKSDYIKIYIPENADLNLINLKTASGKITIDNLLCDRLNLRSSSGKIVAEKVTAKDMKVNCTSGSIEISDCKSDSFDFTLTSGKLTAEDIISNDLSADLTSGSAYIEGELKGKSKLRLISGSLKMNINGAKEDYSRYISVVSGSVKIDGEKGYTDSNSSAKNSLDIKITSGNADINFEK